MLNSHKYDLKDFHLKIYALDGAKQIIPMLYTKIEFKNDPSFLRPSTELEKKTKIYLPTFKNSEDLYFNIELKKERPSYSKIGTLIEGYQVRVRSLNNLPFKINGQFSFEALLTLGDRLLFGGNEIHFDLNHKNNLDPFDDEIYNNSPLYNSNLNVLIYGETGTGKSYLANKIHQKSNLKGPFIALNISSFRPQLIESELFGHCKGAFTGACQNRLGHLRKADGGTLFIDEIDSLSYDLQVKLLLYLDHQKIRPVGSDQEFKGNARLVFASRKSPQALLSSGQMREDFFFRICNGHICSLNPLRDNRLKIRNICLWFAKQNKLVIDNELIEFYQLQKWPGNIRQLIGHLKLKKTISQIERIRFDSTDERLLDMPYFNIYEDDYPFQSLEETKMKYALLTFYRWNKDIQKTCEVLKITRPTLRSLIKNEKLKEDRCIA